MYTVFKIGILILHKNYFIQYKIKKKIHPRVSLMGR